MPDEDLTAQIHFRLHNYSLRKSDRGIHLYEALSYVWVSPESPKVVYINNHSLSITANLYTALLHLRYRSFERIIWVDSICINQEDNTEKSHQIQLIAKIIGQANRVIVYLDDAADGSNQALESIRVAAEGESPEFETPEGGYLKQEISEMNQRGVFELLKRPWFEPICVFQEVGFAQQILIMCGSATIDGLGKSDPSGDVPNERSVLVDMYHTRKATKRHDKIYALLGKSSNSPNLAGLLPDYKVTWTTLLERLVKFILPQNISVKTWESKEVALIESKGDVLGYAFSIDDDSTRFDRHTRWCFQDSAKPIRQGDLVCLLQGASKPAIIRATKDHFAIILIAATLQKHTQEQIRNNLQGQAEYEGIIENHTSVPDYLNTDSVAIIAGKFGKEAMTLLLEKQREEVVITGEVIKTAVGNSYSGEEVIKLLLEKMGEEVIIPEEVLEVAERRSHLKEKVMELLLKHRATNVMILEETPTQTLTLTIFSAMSLGNNVPVKLSLHSSKTRISVGVALVTLITVLAFGFFAPKR
ncbi:hypothetical protein BPOR_0556g00010 [Botrytis porri]|uniref:Heterokaryon incompatibility domain-containing protein n=1 Tax=Botrytis porri TaxID=87229 RepID=A0A4Z1KEE6_9HELO|nr:hypothetical protein BPOR_0556g00010 [Botrytis porri]